MKIMNALQIRPRSVGQLLHAPFCGNAKRRSSFAVYAMGLLGNAERKSVEPMAALVCHDPRKRAADRSAPCAQPTHVHNTRKTTFHIDFMFIPARWLHGATVAVFSDGVWRRHSDHFPVVVHLDEHRVGRHADR
jgi:hypothetical protein